MSRRRAYRPARSTFDLRDRVRALPWITKIEIEAPHHGTTVIPARFLITDGDGKRSPMSFEQARRLTGPEPSRCHGITTNGSRCSRFLRSNHRYCTYHR